jgi:hypothetical protein
MGARINFVFKDSEQGPLVVLYSHWGQTEWQRDLAMALQHSKPRWIDASYGTRMMISYLTKGIHRRITEPRKRIFKMISYLTQDSVLDETGFGIYAISNDGYDLGEQTVLIDFTTKTVTDNVSVNFDKFVAAYSPLPV